MTDVFLKGFRVSLISLNSCLPLGGHTCHPSLLAYRMNCKTSRFTYVSRLLTFVYTTWFRNVQYPRNDFFCPFLSPANFIILEHWIDIRITRIYSHESYQNGPILTGSTAYLDKTI